jgi:adenine-specific DNA-methyltransferase
MKSRNDAREHVFGVPSDVVRIVGTVRESQLQLWAAARSTDGMSDDRAARGAIYTPKPLADWVAGELCALLGGAAEVWDIACGDGALLEAVERVAPGSHSLAGFDIDEAAVSIAQMRLPHARLQARDALDSHPFDGRPDAIILNPPWGARLSHSPLELRSAGFELARGQFDSYDVFVERSLELLPRGGIAAIILPDSVFNPEHRQLRRLLVERTCLQLIARLGEGFFPAVYRGTVVMVVVKAPPPPGHTVRCTRLRPADRRAVLRGEITLASAARRLSHEVAQATFADSALVRFDIDVRERDRRAIHAMESANPMNWREWLGSGRGVELSKHGKVVLCPRCGAAAPAPRRQQLRCTPCDFSFEVESARHTQIVQPIGVPDTDGDWRPLIAGEDVRRFRATASRLLKVGVPGIVYKSASGFAAPKLLVRKTGVGLTCAVDDSGSYTTQVVFHYVPRHPHTASFLLDYLAGVLNSRVMLSYYLQTRGESEWRSHPYVTQRLIEELPVPAPLPGTWWEAQAREIAAQAKLLRATAKSDLAAELQLERLVIGLYGLGPRDWKWVLRVVADAQPLVGIKELRLNRDVQLSALRVAA